MGKWTIWGVTGRDGLAPPPQFAASGQQVWGNASNVESTFWAQWYILSQPTAPSFAARGAFGTGFSHKDRSADK